MSFTRIHPPKTNHPTEVGTDLSRQMNLVLNQLERYLDIPVVAAAPSGTAGADPDFTGAKRVLVTQTSDGARQMKVYERLFDTSDPPQPQWGRRFTFALSSLSALADNDLLTWDDDADDVLFQSSATLGLVSGPASATDNAVARFDGTGGKTIQNSGVIVDDTDNVTGMTTLTLPNTGLHLLDTDASHDLIVAPGANLTAERTLTVTTPDAALTLNLSTVTAGRFLRADGTNWLASTLTIPDTVAISTLLYASAANIVSALATGNNGILVTSGTGVPSIGTDIPTDVTIGGAYIYRVGGTDVGVADGGTDVSTFTTNGVLYGNGASAVQVTSQGAANSVLTANAGAPSFSDSPTLAALTVNGDLRVNDQIGLGLAPSANGGSLQIRQALPSDPTNIGMIRLLDTAAVAADVGASLSFGGKYTAGGSYADWAIVKGLKENATDSNFSGYLMFGTRTSGSNMSERFRIDSAGVLRGVTGAVIGTAQSVGNTLLLSAYDVDGAAYTTFATLTANNTPTMTLSNVTSSTNFNPTSSDGGALGTTSLMWSDLFLASAGVINFNAGNYTITHAAGLLTFSGDVRVNDQIAIGGAAAAGTGSFQIYAAPPSDATNVGHIRVIDTTALAANTGGGINFGGVYNAGGSRADWALIRGRKENATDSNFSGYLSFGTRASGAGMAEVGRFTSAGRFGVNATAPSGMADIVQSSTTGAIPVIEVTQADVSEEFIRFIGTSANAVLTQSIVEAADVATFTTVGYLQIYVQDDGNQVADGRYYVAFGTLA